MEKLTLEYSIENKFTPNMCVNWYFPDYSDEQCNYVLWEETCFPMSMETTLEQLYKMYLKSTQPTPKD
jgi:hypothetical protein